MSKLSIPHNNLVIYGSLSGYKSNHKSGAPVLNFGPAAIGPEEIIDLACQTGASSKTIIFDACNVNLSKEHKDGEKMSKSSSGIKKGNIPERSETSANFNNLQKCAEANGKLSFSSKKGQPDGDFQLIISSIPGTLSYSTDRGSLFSEALARSVNRFIEEKEFYTWDKILIDIKSEYAIFNNHNGTKQGDPLLVNVWYGSNRNRANNQIRPVSK
jgi:hypothetical protein